MDNMENVRAFMEERGKKGTAEYIKLNEAEDLLNRIFQIIFDPENEIDDYDLLTWMKWLMAGGNTPEEFAAAVRKYDNATTCGLVWTANFVAYRCRTCGISPCMSLCAECFQRGHHEGHDFNMFRSQAGGACDCGDTSVMKTCGFCDRHGEHNITRKLPPPTELLYIPMKMAPRIFLRLILHLRELSLMKTVDPTSKLDTNEFLTVLSNLSSMGAAMRKVLTKALVSRELYCELTSSLPNHEIEQADLLLHNNCAPDLSEGDTLYVDISDDEIDDTDEDDNYYTSSPSQLRVSECLKCLKMERVPLNHKNFLEELVFWTVKYEFPQKVVCFLLNMLPDSVYKEALTESFVMHYSRISLVLEASTDPDTLSNRVVHVSVQLFSNEQLAVRMTGNFNLLEVMVISLKRMMGRILVPSPVHFVMMDEDYDSNERVAFHQKVVNCASAVMKEHCYWPLVSDLNNVLSHRPIALQFMQHPTLPEMWFSFLAYYQGMNVNEREISQHVEFEPNTYYAAFSAELEASAYPMWAMLSHLVSSKTIPLTKAMLFSCMKILKNWLKGANINVYPSKFHEQVSFHIPLHRYLATFICQAVNVQGVALEDVIPSHKLLPMLMKHPLRIQTAFYEITHGLWVRNGLQIKGQAMTYIQCNFCSSMVDADLYLLQICITRQPLNDVMIDLIDKFRLKKSLSFISLENTSGKTDGDVESAMLEGFLQFLATLTNIRTNLGQSFSTTTRLEMVTLLCMTDKTHSQLTELMPERCGIAPSRDFDSILSNVAEYKAPIFEASGNMQQGLYVPKSCVWEQYYDPVHVLLRSVHRRDFQSSMDRYTDYVKQSGKMPTNGSLWPPYRIPEPCNSSYIDPRIVLNNRTFHAVIWICLYKSVHFKNVNEQVISLTIYLLEMALSIDAETHSIPSYVEEDGSDEEHVVEDLMLSMWFQSDNLSRNMRTVIRKVKVDRQIVPYYCKFDNNNFYTAGRRETDTTVGHDSVSSGSGSSAIEGVTGFVAPPVHTHQLIPHEELDLENLRNFENSQNFQNLPNLSPEEDNNSDSEMESSTPTSESSYSDKFTFSDMDNTVQSDKEEYVYCDMNESIISLLLKLHSNLSGIPNSFDPDNVDTTNILNRIASGPEFVEKVLIRVLMLDEDCRREIYATRELIWPTAPVSSEQEKIEAEEAERKAKKILAKERQMKIIEDFINRQKKFLENTKETMENEMDWEGAVEPKEAPAVEYHCVICNGSSPTTEEQPMANIVLMQATSVIGHKHRSNCQPVLPVSEDELCRFQPENTLAADFEKKMEELSHEFSDSSWWLSINIGWEGGIHIQTCGHHIHIECIKSYLQSLRGQQRVAIDKGEFLCPLCRQLSNSILPIAPAIGSCTPVASPKSTNIKDLIVDITNLMTTDPITELTVSPLEDALQKTMEDINSATHPKMSQNGDPRQIPSSLLFVTSIARINLEVEIIQRGGNLCNVGLDSSKTTEINDLTPKRSCIVPLFYMLGARARRLVRWATHSSWTQTAGIPEAHTPLEIPPHPNEKPVPMLIKDVSAILIQFVLLLPFNFDHNYYECLVKLLYNLLYFQIISQLLTNQSPMERNYWRNIPDRISERIGVDFSLDDAMKLVVVLLDRDMFFDEDDTIDDVTEPSRMKIEKNVQELALPFLRLASMIRYHLYNDPIPNDITSEREFERLVYYLRLAEPLNFTYFSPTGALTWQSGDTSVVNDWFSSFSQYIHRNQLAARCFLSDLHIKWKQPRLLQLPNEYSKLFQFYHRKECLRCHTVPQEASVCLVCGKLVCLKQMCCKFGGKMCEAVQHSLACGAGTGMFLIVPYSTIIIIRGRRTCVWGSVYLDKFGEEDRELKRGKPLYLSNERYRLLEQQWLSHKFDNINKKWMWHRDSL